MSAFNTLFVLNSYGELEINKLEVRKIPEYDILFKRDRGSDGDYNGSKKLIACAEIYYIYLVYDVRSIYYNLPLEQRKLKAIKDCKFKDTWKETKELDNAILRYKEDFKLSAAGMAYVVAEKSYRTFTKDTQDLLEELVDNKNMLNNLLKVHKNRDTGTGLKLKDDFALTTRVQEIAAVINEIVKAQGQIMANIKSFASLGDAVKLLATKFIEEGGNLKVPVGGGDLGNREI